MTDPIKLFKQNLDKSIETIKQKRMEEDRRVLMSTIGQDLARMMTPVLNSISSTSRMNKAEMKEVMSELIAEVVTMQSLKQGIDTQPITEAIEQAFGSMYIPEPKVTVNVPEMKPQKLLWPEGEMSIGGWVKLMGVSLENPLPVQLRNADGSPFSLAENINISAGGGGRGVVKVSGFDASAWANLGIINGDGRLRVETNDGTSSASTEVKQVSGAVDSVVVNDILAVSTTFPVNQVSGANWSVTAIATDLDIRDLDFATDDVSVYQVSGHSWSTASTLQPNSGVDIGDVDVTSVTPGTGAGNLGKSEDGPHTTGDVGVMMLAVRKDVAGPFGADNDYSPLQLDSSGYVRMDANTHGDVPSDTGDSGNPVKVGGQARTTNPIAVTDADRVNFTADDLGRQLVRPFQVRDLTVTAYVSVTGGTETTLLAGSAGNFHDCLMITGSNNSDAAVSVDIRAVTGGNILHTMRIPANSMAGWAPALPWPQDATGNNWTVDGPDETGRTLTFSGLFVREV